MRRRGFLSLLASGLAVAAVAPDQVDLERLAWQPWQQWTGWRPNTEVTLNGFTCEFVGNERLRGMSRDSLVMNVVASFDIRHPNGLDEERIAVWNTLWEPRHVPTNRAHRTPSTLDFVFTAIPEPPTDLTTLWQAMEPTLAGQQARAALAR